LIDRILFLLQIFCNSAVLSYRASKMIEAYPFEKSPFLSLPFGKEILLSAAIAEAVTEFLHRASFLLTATR